MGKIKEAIKVLTTDSENNNKTEYKPVVGTSKIINLDKVEESFKGDIQLNTVRFPAELGEEHPFDFEVNENLYKTFGLVQAIIDKYVDQIIGPGFYIKSENEKAEEIINQWLKDVNWDTLFRHWAKEALVKGTGFLEMSGKLEETPSDVKVLDAKRMFIKRDKFGVTEGYNQLKAKNLSRVTKDFSRESYIEFKPHEIAHISLNTVGDCPYGYGILEPVKSLLLSLVANQIALDEIMKRKAEVKYLVQVGDKDNIPTQEAIDNFREKLEYQENKHEWVVDGLTNIKPLDFGIPGEKFTFPLEYYLQVILYSVQIPEVLMGKGNIPEGLAKVQLDAFERRIKSFQAEFEKVIEGQIFRRILLANKMFNKEGMLAHVEFEWGQPSLTDKMERLTRLKELVGLPFISPSLKKELEKDIARQLDYPDNVLETIEEEKEREAERPQPIIPGGNRGEIIYKGELIYEKLKQPKTFNYTEEELKKDYQLHEWLGFNYVEYVSKIIDYINNDKFEDLSANNEIELRAGYLNSKQVSRLKRVLKDGFIDEKNILEINNDVREIVKPKNLYSIKDNKIETDDKGNPIVLMDSNQRSMMITRTETTRTAVNGSIDYYDEKGIEQVQFVASLGQRTCPICEGLNGRIYNLEESYDVIPGDTHPNCRCSWVPVIK